MELGYDQKMVGSKNVILSAIDWVLCLEFFNFILFISAIFFLWPKTMTFAIVVCEYYVHVECQDFAVTDCKENATYVPGKHLAQVHHQHHWREGNLPKDSKCALCKKNCCTTECLSGFRCEWCGMTVRTILIQLLITHFYSVCQYECTFIGNFKNSFETV